MSCSEFEKSIYLYRELSATERKIADEHIARCKSCSEMASQVLLQQEMIKKARSIRPVPGDSDWLTHSIVNAVERKEKSPRQFYGITSLLDHLYVRYAFSTLSLLLITFFYLEQQDVKQRQPVAKVEIKQGTILDTSSFLKTHLMSRQKRETPFSVSRYSYHRSERVAKTL